jgi:hypothetical protein
VLKKELMAHLRTARQMRQAKGGTTKSGLGQIVDTVSISRRNRDSAQLLLDDSRRRKAAGDGRTWSKGATERTIGPLWPPEGH